MKSLEAMLSILDLFDEGHSQCTLEQAHRFLPHVSEATVYRYLQCLSDAGLIADGPGKSFILGPRIIELDRVMQQSDPLLEAAQKCMPHITGLPAGVALLNVAYGKKVVCIHSESFGKPAVATHYRRGRPMPLFRSVSSKIILAYLSPYQLRSLFNSYGAEIKAAGLGNSLEDLRENLRSIRKNGFVCATSELTPGLVGIAVPLVIGSKIKKILGSLSYLIDSPHFDFSRQAIYAEELRHIGAKIVALVGEEPEAQSDRLDDDVPAKPQR